MPELEDTDYWTTTHNQQTRSIELDWKPATAEMTSADFQVALERLAEHIGEQKATGTLIDVRTFKFALTPELDAWRKEKIIPAYNSGGLRRFAYLLPSGAEYRPGDGGEGADFQTEYFDDPAAARTWLAAV
jgi:hypothetical protein